MERFDAIVIGAGHNGLTAAAYLARAGLSVLVLEKNDRIGGVAANREIVPGFTFSAAHRPALRIRSQVVRDLELGRHGLSLIPDPGTISLLPEGGYLATYGSVAESIEEIRQHSHGDAESYEQFVHRLRRHNWAVEPLLHSSPAPPVSKHRRSPQPSPSFANRCRALGEAGLSDLIYLVSSSMSDILNEEFETPALASHLAGPALLGLPFGPLSPMTGLHLLNGVSHAFQSDANYCGYPRGGTGAVSRALVGALLSYGGEVRTRNTVTDIVMKDKRASGVVTESGEQLEAGMVLSSLDLKRTILTMFDWRALGEGLVDKIGSFRMEGVAAHLNLALDGLPDFPTVPTACQARGGEWQIALTLPQIERAYDDWKNKIQPRQPHIVFRLPTLADPGLAPDDKHIMSVTVQYVPFSFLDGGWNEEKKDAFSELVINAIGDYSPNLKDLISDLEVLVPPDLEAEFGLTQGDYFQGVPGIDQLFFNRPLPALSNYAMPIDRLYLCGSSAHPGNAVTGMPGALAAEAAIQRMRGTRR